MKKVRKSKRKTQINKAQLNLQTHFIVINSSVLCGLAKWHFLVYCFVTVGVIVTCWLFPAITYQNDGPE